MHGGAVLFAWKRCGADLFWSFVVTVCCLYFALHVVAAVVTARGAWAVFGGPY